MASKSSATVPSGEAGTVAQQTVFCANGRQHYSADVIDAREDLDEVRRQADANAARLDLGCGPHKVGPA